MWYPKVDPTAPEEDKCEKKTASECTDTESSNSVPGTYIKPIGVSLTSTSAVQPD